MTLQSTARTRARESAINTLAKTIMGEAADQSYEGMLGVGNNIANRQAAWGGTLESQAMAPGQYSAWNSLDNGGNKLVHQKPSQKAIKAATAIVDATVPDNTESSTYYNVASGARVSKRGLARQATDPDTVTIGDHTFYNYNDTPEQMKAIRDRFANPASPTFNPAISPAQMAIDNAYHAPVDAGYAPTAADRNYAPQPSVQNPHPDVSVNPYGGLLGGLGAGVTAAIQGFNGIGSAVKAIGGMFAPGQQPSVSLPHHPQTPTPLSGIGPVGPVSYGGSLGATGVNAPHTPTPSTAYGGNGYQSTAGSSNPYQGASHPYESGYTPSYSQLAPGAATATQMFGADPSPVATAKPSFTTTRSLNPNYEKEMAAYNAYQNANIPSAVDSFMENPSLSAVTPGTFESAFPSAPKPATPAPPKPQQYVTKQVPNKPFSPSFAAGTPVMDAIGNIVGAMGLNGKAFTPSFAPGTSVMDQNGNVVGSMTGQGMQTQKPSLLGGLMSALGIGGGMSQGMGSNGAGLVGGMAPGGLNAYGNMKAGGWGNSGNGSMGGGYSTSNEGGNLHG